LVQAYGEEVEGISNIRVALLDPGATRTAMRERAYPGEDPASVKPPEMVADKIAELIASDAASGHFERIA